MESSAPHKEEGANKNESKPDNEKDRSENSEIILGSKSIDSDTNDHACSANSGSRDDLWFILSGNETDHSWKAESENGGQNVIDGCNSSHFAT